MNVSSYLLIVSGTIIFSVIVSIVMPSGRVAVYAKSVLGLFVFFVIVSPIINFLSKDSNDILNSTSFEIEKDFVISSAEKQIEAYQNTVQKIIKTDYNLDSIVEISFYLEDFEIVIKKVVIKLQNAVLNAEKINTYESIKEKISTFLKVQKEEILLYG